MNVIESSALDADAAGGAGVGACAVQPASAQRLAIAARQRTAYFETTNCRRMPGKLGKRAMARPPSIVAAL